MGLKIYNSRICISGLIPTFYAKGNAKEKGAKTLDESAPGRQMRMNANRLRSKSLLFLIEH